VRHAELIVRVPQMLVLYNEDQDKLDNAQEMFASLFNFYEYKIINDMKQALPTIESVADEVVQKFNSRDGGKFWFYDKFLILIYLSCLGVFVSCLLLGYYVLLSQLNLKLMTLNEASLAYCNVVHPYRNAADCYMEEVNYEY
jgi:cytochrome b subunit of formate dehydrogenase